MTTIIKARYTNGIFKPLEDLDIAEGKEVILTIDESSTSPYRPGDGLRAAAGGWKGLIDGENLKKEIYESRLICTRPEVKL